MQPFTILALILATCISLQAQDIMILENGGTMPMKEFEKMKDKPNCIGFYNQRTERLYYRKQLTNMEDNDLAWGKYSKDNAVERVLEGPINLYRRPLHVARRNSRSNAVYITWKRDQNTE